MKKEKSAAVSTPQRIAKGANTLRSYSNTEGTKMQEIYIDPNQIPEPQMRRLCEGAYKLLAKLQSTEEGREMLRKEMELMRKEKGATQC